MIIWSVAVGVGVFLVVALLRVLFGIRLGTMLVAFYALVFVMCPFVSSDFWAIAFDSGGVTTGPMTVPFIMALGVGVSSMRSDKHAENDSFGLVALCSVGPILATLLLGIFYRSEGGSYVPVVVPDVADSRGLIELFTAALPTYLHEVCRRCCRWWRSSSCSRLRACACAGRTLRVCWSASCTRSPAWCSS